MIPDKPDNIVETNLPNGKLIKFRFESDRHLFDAFSKNLYANPHDSMVREVISNAIDANTRAGKNFTTLKIILNTSEFIVEDQGAGIDEWKMENVVGVYGKSDKRDTNEEIGMYGFGFKSPFAVTDQFIVETVPGDGKKYIWVIYKDLSGSGEIKLTSCVESDQPTGTKVRVPIKTSDNHKINMAIQKYTMFMDPQPVVYLSSNTIPRRIENESEGADWLKTKIGTDYNVLYDGWMPYKLGVEFYDKLLIKFRKDEIRFSPSREQIKEDDKVKELFIKRASKYWDEYFANKKTEIENIDNPFIVFKQCLELCDTYYKYFKEQFKGSINSKKYGNLQLPIELNFNVTIYDYNKYRGNRLNTFGLREALKLPSLYFVYMPDNEMHKINSGYYILKFRKILKENHGVMVTIVKESEIGRQSLIVNEIIKDAINLKDIKITKTGDSGSPRKYKKGHIIGYAYDGTRMELPVENGEYIYCVNKYELDAFNSLGKLPNIKYCKVNKRTAKKLKEKQNWFTPREYINNSINKIDKTKIDDLAYNRSIKSISNVYRTVVKEKEVKTDAVEQAVISLGFSMGMVASSNLYSSDKIIKEYNKKYPLLQLIPNYNFDPSKKKYIEHYVKLIDGEQK